MFTRKYLQTNHVEIVPTETGNKTIFLAISGTANISARCFRKKKRHMQPNHHSGITSQQWLVQSLVHKQNHYYVLVLWLDSLERYFCITTDSGSIFLFICKELMWHYMVWNLIMKQCSMYGSLSTQYLNAQVVFALPIPASHACQSYCSTITSTCYLLMFQWQNLWSAFRISCVIVEELLCPGWTVVQ